MCVGTKDKVKTNKGIKFQHDSAHRALADLQMPPLQIDCTQLELYNFKGMVNQNETHGISAFKGNNDQIADARSVSKDESWNIGTTFVESNAMEEYVQHKNYDPEWMEMDGDYKKLLHQK